MNKPNRHRNHILETESNKFFSFQVPNEWYIDKPDHDYGIDYIVNIVTNNQVTGLSFSVQLKSKIEEKKDDFAVISLKHSTLGLFNTKLEPVLIVAYIQEEKEAYWCWYNELEFDLTSSQKSYTINIPKANKLSQIDWGSISKYVQDIFSVKMLVDGIKSLEYEEISNSHILAWKYYFSQDYEKSIFYFKNLLVENPNDIAILEGLAQSQYNTFHYKEAINNINKAIASAKIASASTRANETHAVVVIDPAAAGLRPTELIRAAQIRPIPTPGPMKPKVASPAPMSFADSASITFFLPYKSP